MALGFSGPAGAAAEGDGCGRISTSVKGSTVVMSLVLGGVSEPSQSSRFPGAEVFRGTSRVGRLEDCQGNRLDAPVDRRPAED
jgi:hypothetical protein